jgi:hypothetical protein
MRAAIQSLQAVQLSSWQAFECARCHEEQRAAKIPESGLCDYCHEAIRREQEWQAEQGRRQAAEQKAREERWQNWPRSLAELGVPPHYCRVPRDLPTPASCAGWRGEPWAITVLGPPGRGKTWLATRIWGEVACDLGSGMWIDAALAIEKIYADIRAGHGSRTMDELLEARVLLLDDVLCERSDLAMVRDKMGLVIRTRYNNLAPTLFTANAVDEHGEPSLDGIDILDPTGRLSSRLERGRAIKVDGPDRRRLRP